MILSKKAWEQTCFFDKGNEEKYLPVQLDTHSRIVIYGAGYAGLMFLELLRGHGIEPDCLLDMSPLKQGRKIMGTPVYAPDKMRVEGATVIVCLLGTGDIFCQIKNKMLELGCCAVFHLYELRENRALFEKQPLIISPNRDLLWDNRDSLYQVFQMLKDDLSRQTLMSVIRFLWGNLEEPIPSLPMEDQYFAEDVYKLQKTETFVDCGAHVGEILHQFLLRSKGQFDAYWAFEPDAHNISALKKKHQQEIQCRPCTICHVALGDQPGTVRVRNYDGSNSVITESGEEETPVITLDSFADQLRPTILKIDVEGWESRLLTGAQKIIQRDKPVIVIAIYHKEQDFWEIPLRLKQLVPEYHFYLRSYLNVAETVLYAIPPERAKEKDGSL